MPTTTPRRVNASDTPDEPAVEEVPVDDDAQTDDETETETDRVEAHRRTVAGGRPVTAGRGRALPDRYGSFGAFAIACARGEVSPEDRRRIGFALSDLTTEGIPGLLPPQWVSGFADVLAASRPVIEAFTTIPLPDVGMSMDWPVRTRTLPLTGVQAAEKTEIVSGEIAVSTEPSPVVTWAGGNDVAIQAIERSQPSLATLLLEELGYDLAYNADRQVAQDIFGKATGGLVPITTAAEINKQLAHAAAIVFGARYGAVPDRLVLGLDSWEFFAGAADADGRPLFPNMNGVNPVGVLSFTDLNGEVRGLRVICSPDIETNYGILGWSRAATTALGPVRTMTADQPAVLGRDIAVYQYGSWKVRRPDALVQITTTGQVEASSGSSKSSKSSS